VRIQQYRLKGKDSANKIGAPHCHVSACFKTHCHAQQLVSLYWQSLSRSWSCYRDTGYVIRPTPLYYLKEARCRPTACLHANAASAQALRSTAIKTLYFFSSAVGAAMLYNYTQLRRLDSYRPSIQRIIELNTMPQIFTLCCAMYRLQWLYRLSLTECKRQQSTAALLQPLDVALCTCCFSLKISHFIFVHKGQTHDEKAAAYSST